MTVAPGPFIWGVTSSSLSYEGAGPAADWSAWERANRAPPSLDGNGFATNYVDDLRLVAGLGCTAVTITVEWARLEPRRGPFHAGVVEHYRDLLTAARRAGLDAWVCLHHTTTPGWFADDERGFTEDRNVESIWLRHVDRCAETFEDLAAGWIPFHDPVGWALRAYQFGTRPPGLTRPDLARDAITGALDATFGAWRLLRSGGAPVMGVFGLPTVKPLHPEAAAQTRLLDELLWRSWSSAIRDGLLWYPWRAPVEREDLVGAFDLIGIDYSYPIGVDGYGDLGAWPASDRRDGSGFAPNAEELSEVIHRAADATGGRPLVVAANGVTTDDDDWRDELLGESLRRIELARRDGVDVRGYFHDTAIDAYDPDNGLSGRRGLLDRDRRPKSSAERFTTATSAV